MSKLLFGLKVIVELGTDRVDDDMQSDINKIFEWCETWSMELSPEKMHDDAFGETIKPGGLFHCRKKLSVTKCQRNLGVLVSADGTWHEKVNSAASKATRVLGLMKSTFSS